MSKTKRKNDGYGLAGHGIRNEMALAAFNRKAGPMKDRREQRGGSRNRQRDFLSDLD